MRMRLMGMASLVAVGALACDPPDDAARAAAVPSAHDQALASATAIWRSADGHCPDVAPADGGEFVAQPALAGPLPPAFERLCAYRWRPAVDAPTSADLGHLEHELARYVRGHGRTRAFELPEPTEVDLPVVYEQGAVGPALYAALEQQTFERASRPLGPYPQAGRVRVAVLDSATTVLGADGREVRDSSGHGRTIARLVEQLACPEGQGDCRVEVQNALALPLVDGSTEDRSNGGYFGTRRHLAEAILDTLRRWGEDLRSDPDAPRRLIINLSIGWDPTHGLHGKGSQDVTPANALVYLALERASCLGALVVAASGNAVGSSREQPTMPAYWEHFPVLLPDECADHLLPGDEPMLALRDPFGESGYHPLVHTAAAVDQYDLPLFTTRTKSTPRFVAYGLGAVSDPAAEGQVRALSGTSVSAAVLSAAFAAAWSARPELPSSDLADLVYRSAVPLADLAGEPRATEHFFWGRWNAETSTYVRRVSVCDATRAALCRSGGDCTAAPPCDTPPAGHADGALALGDMTAFGTLEARACRGEACLPAVPVYGDAPWVFSQPGGRAGCGGGCAAIRSSASVAIELDETALEETRELFVELDNGVTYAVPRPADGGYPAQFRIEVPDLASAQRASLTLLVGEGESAHLTREALRIVP